MLRGRAWLAAALLTAAAAPGQGEVAAPAATPSRAAPLLHAVVGGPAIWRTHLAPTNVGSLLASQEGQALWQPLTAALESLLAPAFGGRTEFTAARRRFLDYRGALDLKLWLEDDLPTAELRLLPDGDTDLQALADDLARVVVAGSGRTWQALGDTGIRTFDVGETGLRLTQPTVVGDVALAVLAPSREVATALQQARSAVAAPAAAATHGPARPPLTMTVDVAAGVATIDDEWVELLGLHTLEEFRCELGAAGPQVRLDLEQQFGAGDRRLFAAFFPDRQRLPATAWLQGEGATGWKAGWFDPTALYETVVAVGESFDDDFRADTERRLGGDPRQGALRHFTGEYVMFGSLDSATMLDSDALTWGLAFRVTDEAAAGELWRAICQQAGAGVVDEVDHDGVTLQRLGGLFPSWAAVGRGLFVTAFGPEAELRVRELLDAARDAPGWQQREGPPESLDALLRHAPPGCNGAAEGHVGVVWLQAGTALGLIGELIDGRFEFWSTDADAQDPEAIEALLEQHNLARAWTMTGYRDGRWHFRVLW